jgi:hypothetical protein
MSFVLIGLSSLATALLLAFSVKETARRDNFFTTPGGEGRGR